MPRLSVAVDDGQPEQAPFICKIHHSVLEPAKHDVAAISGDGGANPRFQQFLDDLNRFGVLRREYVPPAPSRMRWRPTTAPACRT